MLCCLQRNRGNLRGRNSSLYTGAADNFGKCWFIIIFLNNLFSSIQYARCTCTKRKTDKHAITNRSLHKNSEYMVQVLIWARALNIIIVIIIDYLFKKTNVTFSWHAFRSRLLGARVQPVSWPQGQDKHRLHVPVCRRPKR